MRLLSWVLVNTLALAVAVWLFAGVRLTGTNPTDRLISLIVVGVIFGLVSGIVKPVVKLLSLPFIILTLGLLLLVINAAMLLLTSHIAGWFHLGFHVDGFGTAVLAGLVIAVVMAVLGALLKER